jgi:hypothetical protein
VKIDRVNVDGIVSNMKAMHDNESNMSSVCFCIALCKYIEHDRHTSKR